MEISNKMLRQFSIHRKDKVTYHKEHVRLGENGAEDRVDEDIMTALVPLMQTLNVPHWPLIGGLLQLVQRGGAWWLGPHPVPSSLYQM